jgi:uncharacterized membrane protein
MESKEPSLPKNPDTPKPFQQPTFFPVTVSQTFSGPIPPPQAVAGYEEICPGSAKIIIDSFEQQTRHRIEMERAVLESQEREQLRVHERHRRENSLRRQSLWSALAVVMTLILGSIALIVAGFDTAGLVALGTTIVGLAGAFIWRESKNK